MRTNTSFLLTHSFLPLNIYASALILSWFFPDSCTFNNGGCSHTCTSLRQWKVQCSCPADMQLMEDGKNCQNGKLLTAIKRKNSTFLPVFMAFEVWNNWGKNAWEYLRETMVHLGVELLEGRDQARERVAQNEPYRLPLPAQNFFLKLLNMRTRYLISEFIFTLIVGLYPVPPCHGKTPVINPRTRRDYFCGKDAPDCPANAYCHISPVNKFAKCCPGRLLLKISELV